MSNEVDKRIVEMQFKNEDFERNASRTLQTLQELKARLNNNFSTKGPEQLNQAIKAVDVSPLTKGLETVQVKLSALQIAGKRVIENLTDMAMNAVAKVRNALSAPINQIITGGAARAQNIEQAKFMLSGLGIQWKDIVDDINYGVQDTAYGLDAAAKVASQLVASNVSLGEDMKSSLRGVSGVAAMTNSTYEEIGHIFTSVAGQGKLMSMQLQQFSLRGLNVAADLAKSMNTTEAAIRDMVSKGQIDFMTFAKAMDELYGGHAKEANNTFSGALSNTKAALSRLGADIQTQKFESFRIVLLAVTTQLKELKKAFKPAEDAIISAMEAVGKLVEAFVKSIDIKKIVEKITPAIEKAANFIRDFADAWREIREEAKPAKNIAEYVQKLKGETGDAKESAEEVVDVFEKLTALTDEQINKHKDQAWDIWNFGTYGNGQDRVDALKEDYELTQAYVDKMIELGWDQVKMDEYIAEERKKAQEAEEKSKRVNNLKDMVRNVLAIFDNLKIVVNNVYTSIKNIIRTAFGGLGDAFENVGFLGAIVNITAYIANFSNKIAITKERADKLRPIFKVIGEVLVVIAKAIYNCAKFLVNFITAAANSKIVTGIFKAIGNAVKSLFDAIGKLYTKLKESGVWDKFVDILKTIGKWLGERIIDALNGLGSLFSSIGDGAVYIFGKVVDKLKEIVDTIKNGDGWFGKIKDFFKGGVDIGSSWISKAGDKIKDLFGGDGESNESIFKKAYDRAAAFGRGLIEGLNSITFDDLKKAGGIVARIAAVLSVIQLLGSLSTMATGIGRFFGGIGRFFRSLTSVTRAYANRTTAAAVEALGRTLLLIAASIVAIAWTIGTVPGGEETVNKALEIVTCFVGLLAIYEIIVQAIARRHAPTAANRVNLLINARRLSLALILTAVATFAFSVTSMIKHIVNGLEGDDPEGYMASLRAALVIIGIVISMLLISVWTIARIANDMHGLVANDSLKQMATMLRILTNSIIKISLLIVGLCLAMKVINPEEDGAIIALSLVAIGGVMIALLGAVGLMAMFVRGMSAEQVAQVGVMIKMVDVLSRAIARLALILAGLALVFHFIDDDAIKAAMISFGIIFGVLEIMFITIALFKIGDPGEFNLKLTAINRLATMMTLIILAFAGLALSLAQMNEMGVDTDEFIRVVLVMGAIVGLLTIIGGIIGSIGPVAVGLQAFGAALTGVGIAMAGIGAGVLMIVAAMYFLDRFIDKIDEFREKVLSKKDVMVACIGDLIGIVAQGLFVGLIQALNALINNMEPIVEALIDTVIALFTTLGTALNNRASELADASYILVKGITKVIVEVLYESIGAIIEGLQDSIAELRDKTEKWWAKMRGNEDYDKYLEDHGEYKDTMAIAYVERLNSSAYDAKQKAAWKEWLRQNGYDEEGNRTEDWTLETTITVDEAYDIVNNGSTPEQVSDRYERQYQKYDTSEITKNAEEKAEETKESSSGVLDSLKSAATNAVESGNVATEIKDSFSSVGSELAEGGANLGIGLDSLNMDILNTDSISNASDVIGTEAEETASSFEEYQETVNAKTNTLAVAVENMAKRIQVAMEDIAEKSQIYGAQVVGGFCDGMTSIASMVKLGKTCGEVTDTVCTLFTEKLKIESPSKVFKGYGKYTIEGFANGISDSVSLATASAEAVGEATIYSMRDTIKRLTEDSSYGIDTNPRITPVLDLSNVTEGIGTMNGMLDTSRVVGLGITTSTEARAATSRRLGAIYQNGSNYDDTNAIGALNSLNAEVSTLKDAINGMQVVIDGRALVGQIATPMDKALGRKAMAGRRGI